MGVPLTIDPTGLTFTWSSSNPAVATVDSASGVITPVQPVTLGVTSTITGSAANPDGSVVTAQPQDVEVVASEPATVNTAIA
jgi:uncharacterized protein YjdB